MARQAYREANPRSSPAGMVRHRCRDDRRYHGGTPHCTLAITTTIIRAAKSSAIISSPGRKSTKTGTRSFRDPLPIGVCGPRDKERDRHSTVVCLYRLLLMYEDTTTNSVP